MCNWRQVAVWTPSVSTQRLYLPNFPSSKTFPVLTKEGDLRRIKHHYYPCYTQKDKKAGPLIFQSGALLRFYSLFEVRDLVREVLRDD